MITKTNLTIVSTLIFATSTPLAAQTSSSALKGEITPYLWMAGMDGDITVRDQKASVDMSFSDLLDATDAAGSVLAVLQRNQLVFWGQIDYMSLSSDEIDDSPQGKTLDSDTTIWTLAAGRQFQGDKGKTYDLLLGARQFSMDNSLTIDGVGKFERDFDITDAVLVFRPSLPLSPKWRFNPTISIGAGDSDFTYELWPQFQYKFTETFITRLGYRNLGYKFETDAGNKWDGNQHGFIIGLGGIW
jgi:hypothetical protein